MEFSGCLTSAPGNYGDLAQNKASELRSNCFMSEILHTSKPE
jgi:hypothetical protein